MRLSEFIIPKQRRGFLEKKLKISLTNIQKAHVDDEKTIHCENLIGETTLPLGVAGPLKISSRFNRDKIQSYYIPLATTEGALVASVNRGCKVIVGSGGTTVFVERAGVTRGPVFVTNKLEESINFKNWLDENLDLISKEATKTSSHLKLNKLGSRVTGKYVFVRFYFDTQEAMGMNMATFATQKIIEFINRKTGIKCLSLAGNFDIDKKPAWLNFISQRGFQVWAEVIILKKVVEEVLKTTGEKIFDVWLGKIMLGSAMSGSLGFNAQFANVVAAFFAATGQDLAHVVEGSLGVTVVKVLGNGDLYFSVYLPAVMLGIVGGGTKLGTKKEALSIIGAKSSEELVKVMAGAVLAGEISLLASLAEGSLAKTHEKLGRKK